MDESVRKYAWLEQQSHRRKLERGLGHVLAFSEAVSSWAQESFIRKWVPGPEGGLDLYLQLLEEIPPSLDLIVGDAVHSMRACLDHLVFRLAVQNSPSASEEQLRKTCFPIPERRGGTYVANAVALLSDEARRAVLSFVRYPDETDADSDSIRLMHRLDNMDKHREIAFTHRLTRGSSLGLSHAVSMSFRTMSDPGHLQVGAPPVRVIAGMEGHSVVGTFEHRMLIVLASPHMTERTPVADLLHAMYTRIATEVLPDLEPHLSVPDGWSPEQR